MSTVKKKKQAEPSSQFRKRKTPSLPTATSIVASERSKKNVSKASLAPTKGPFHELINEPLNRVLIADIYSKIIALPTLAMWMEMNLIISIDYAGNVFNVIKNRWGVNAKGLPLDLLATFLYHPEMDDAQQLNLERIRKNNETKKG